MNVCIFLTKSRQPTFTLQKRKSLTPENYISIPKELSKQYKAEIEQIIDEEYPHAVKKTKQIRAEAHKMYKKVLKNKNLYMEYATNNFDVLIGVEEFNLLSKIIDITDKYVQIKDEDALATDYNGALLDFLDPYFKDNDIKTDKLDNLSILINKEHKKIIQEQELLHKFIYPDDKT